MISSLTARNLKCPPIGKQQSNDIHVLCTMVIYQQRKYISNESCYLFPVISNQILRGFVQ